MKIEQHLYRKAKEDARHITEIATNLELLANLEEHGLLESNAIRPDYEEQRKRDIKNAITNIYLVLNLHEVKGVADQIYNKDFQPIE